jgi:hypothetical protein
MSDEQVVKLLEEIRDRLRFLNEVGVPRESEGGSPESAGVSAESAGIDRQAEEGSADKQGHLCRSDSCRALFSCDVICALSRRASWLDGAALTDRALESLKPDGRFTAFLIVTYNC